MVAWPAGSPTCGTDWSSGTALVKDIDGSTGDLLGFSAAIRSASTRSVRETCFYQAAVGFIDRESEGATSRRPTVRTRWTETISAP